MSALDYYHQTPLYCDEPFTEKMPTPPPFDSCCCWCPPCCCISLMLVCQLPIVRGIPTGSTQLSDAEVRARLARCQGHWRIHPLAEATRVELHQYHHHPFTDARFNGTSLIISGAGGMHDHPYHHERMVHIQEQTLDVMHVDQTGVLYVDFMGSMFEDFAPETGFLTMNNAMGVRLTFQRPTGLELPGTAGTGPAPGMIQMAPVVAPPVYRETEDNPVATGTVVCKYCGAEMTMEGAQFCSECGKPQIDEPPGPPSYTPNSQISMSAIDADPTRYTHQTPVPAAPESS